MGRVAVAVSGGVDSLTLGAIAGRVLRSHAEFYHALSAAVPPEATRRTESLAKQEQWNLHIIDAGEFRDADYLRNPLNRCFHCKTSLYAAIGSRTTSQIVSGTNADDLGEYRPGLLAAENFHVRHPYVEASVDKVTVRNIAESLGLDGISTVPASPCLSSRIETGIPIRVPLLKLVHQIERVVVDALQCKTVRCRIRAEGVVVELDASSLSRLTDNQRISLRRSIAVLLRDVGLDGEMTFDCYRNGSAFLHNRREPT